MESLHPKLYQSILVSAIISREYSNSTVINQIEAYLKPEVLKVLKSFPHQKLLIAGGFTAYIFGHTSNHGDVDVFLYEPVSPDYFKINGWRNERNYGCLIDGISFKIYNRTVRDIELQMIVPTTSYNFTFLEFCFKVLTCFDIQYCKLGWVPFTTIVLDLRNVGREEINKYRLAVYQSRLKSASLPVPTLKLLCLEVLMKRK